MKLKNEILNFIKDNSEAEFSPYYVYDSDAIRGKCRDFMGIDYPNKSIHFATMANINADFLRIIKEQKVRVFVNSVLHLKAVMDTGFQGKDIIFTSSGLTKNTMKIIHNSQAQINLDSPTQLKQWQELFPKATAGIRCNIGDSVAPYSNHAGAFMGKKSRLGFTLYEIDEIKDKSKINGLHMYVGTDIKDIDYFINCYNALINIAVKFPNLEYLNFGGGFGVTEKGDDEFDLNEYNSRVTALMQKTSAEYGRDLHLILEPGRIIGGAAGYFVCGVTDIKKREGQFLIGVNASTAQFPRPLMYPDSAIHPVSVIRNGQELSSGKVYNSTIYGSSTYSRDIFSKDILLPKVEVGDIVILGNAGSYSASSYCEFLGFNKPEEYFI